MKQKKKIPLWCRRVALMAAVGVATLLCVGCSIVNTPEDSLGTTTAGDQITEGTPAEGETTPSVDETEIDTEAAVSEGESDGQESQAPSSESSTASPEEPSESATAAPEVPSEPVTDVPVADVSLSYEAYHSMSAEEQKAHYTGFASPAEFFEWYNAAKAKYLEEHPNAEIGPDGSIIMP